MTTTILQGDVRAALATLPDDHFDCVVTSPPYWGLRDYGVDGQMGCEPTLAEHLAVMVEVFADVRRVLKPTGTLWLNYGDCYAAAPNGRAAAAVKGDDRTFRDKPFSTVQGTLKAKDLCMVPNRLAIALQDAGWWVRSEIIWAKPNPMPSSARDRPATAHEKIWLLTKQPRYYWNRDQARMPAVEGSTMLNTFRGGRYTGGQPDHARTSYGQHANESGKRNIRNCETDPPQAEAAELEVWKMATRPFKGAHFATFPPELVKRCLETGCPPGGNVLDPFGGAGTTALVAEQTGCDATLIELNADYVSLAQSRIGEAFPLFMPTVQVVEGSGG